MPAGVFCALLASASPISKRLTETLFLKELEILNGIYFSPEPSQRIRTDRDVRGFVRSEFVVSNSSLDSIQEGMLFNKLFLKAFILYGCITASALSFFPCIFYTFFITFLLSLTYTYANHIPINKISNPGAACEYKLAARLEGVTL